MNEKININNIPQALEQARISPLVRAELGVTRKGDPRLVISSDKKQILIDSQAGLPRIAGGDIGFLVEMLAKTIAIPGDLSAPQLLKMPEVVQACATEMVLPSFPKANFLRSRLVPTRETGIPVFYGSTAGINFAEVLETALCSQAIIDRGTASQVIFDSEAQMSPESQAIFAESQRPLSTSLREKVNNFIQQNGGLASARLQAVRELVDQIGNLPKIDMIDVQQVFEELGSDFTVGQLLLLAKVAGSDPRLLSQGDSHFGSGGVIGILRDEQNRDRLSMPIEMSPLDILAKPVENLINSRTKAAGFTFYARDAIIGRMGGVFAGPFKLTDKANIYKILVAAQALYDPATEQGQILMPITRNRILFQPPLGSTRPVDATVLRILSLEDPQGFQKLVQEFKDNFKVLTPTEALAQGTVDRKFKVEDYLNVQ